MEESRCDSENLEQKVKEHQALLLKYPKNIRQIGEIGDGQRIYVEDYVMTYAMHLAAKTKDSYSSAVLLGQKAIVDGRRTLFISGAVEIPQQWQQILSITSGQWTAVYDQIQKYFHDIDILGCFLTRPGMELKANEQVDSLWRSGFEGTDHVLFLYDNISREEAFYTCKDGEFLHQSGYYIYYEKNEEMQNYMIDQKGGKSSDEGYQDMASRKIRKKIEEKNREHKMYLFRQQMTYTAGILVSAVVLVAAATRLYHSSEEVVADVTGNTQGQPGGIGWALSEWQEENQDLQKDTENETNSTENGEKEEPAEHGGELLDTEGEQSEEVNGDEEVEQQQTGEEVETEIEGKTGNEEKPGGAGQEAAETDSVETAASVSGKGGKKKQTNTKNKIYKVKKGDTLESISIACYGTSRYVKKIKKINQLESADRIYIGQELVLP